MLSKLLGAKAVAAIVLGTAAVGTAAAAATGALPDPAQAKAHHIVAAVPDADPAGHGPAPGPRRPQAGRCRATTGRCRASPGSARRTGRAPAGENGGRLDSTAFGRLADAAGGADKIAAYCRPHRGRDRAAGPRRVTRGLAGACRAWQAADGAGRAPWPRRCSTG